MKIFVLSFFLFTSGAWAKDKSVCSKRELAQMDCHLHVRRYDVRLLAKTIAWNDGTWHTVDDMPLKGAAVAWEKVRLQLDQEWPVLQLWLWDKGYSETDVQSLHWYTGDLIRERPFKVLAEGVVRKRHPEPSDDPNAKPKFLYDKWESHGLKVFKGGKMEWHLGAQKKTITKTQLSNESPAN